MFIFIIYHALHVFSLNATNLFFSSFSVYTIRYNTSCVYVVFCCCIILSFIILLKISFRFSSLSLSLSFIFLTKGKGEDFATFDYCVRGRMSLALSLLEWQVKNMNSFFFFIIYYSRRRNHTLCFMCVFTLFIKIILSHHCHTWHSSWHIFNNSHEIHIFDSGQVFFLDKNVESIICVFSFF